MNTPINRDTVVDALADRLRSDVLSGRYPTGSHLPPERELSAAYGVTRTSLKHAIVRLVQAGLLETKHGVGTRVRDYERLGGAELLPLLVSAAGTDMVREIFEVRREVGALVAATAARHATAGQRDRLRALLDGLANAPDAGAAQLAECEIHRVIAMGTGNRVYGFLVNSLLNAYLEVREAFQGAFDDPPAAAARIAPLVDAVCGADPDAAQAAAGSYLRLTQELMLGGSAETAAAAPPDRTEEGR